MSRPAIEVAKRLAELRALTRKQVAEAEADELKFVEAVMEIERQEAILLSLRSKYNLTRGATSVTGQCVMIVERRARESAHKIAEEAIAVHGGDDTYEVAVDTVNTQSFLEELREAFEAAK
jgi:hypothetical protein